MNKVKVEYERLRSLFSSVDEKKLVNNLIEQAAFMKIELGILQDQISKHGASQISIKVLKDKRKQRSIIQN